MSSKCPSSYLTKLRKYGKSSIHNFASFELVIIIIIIIYHDFLPTPRRGSHVKSDKTHTQSSRYTT